MNIKKMLAIGLARYIFQRAATRSAPIYRTGSKHAGGKQHPRNWQRKKQQKRKVQKLARRAQRGK